MPAHKAENPRNNTIALRVTNEGLRVIKEEAELAGLDLANYCRVRLAKAIGEDRAKRAQAEANFRPAPKK